MSAGRRGTHSRIGEAGRSLGARLPRPRRPSSRPRSHRLPDSSTTTCSSSRDVSLADLVRCATAGRTQGEARASSRRAGSMRSPRRLPAIVRLKTGHNVVLMRFEGKDEAVRLVLRDPAAEEPIIVDRQSASSTPGPARSSSSSATMRSPTRPSRSASASSPAWSFARNGSSAMSPSAPSCSASWR